MEPIKLNATGFANRIELDEYVRNEIGEDIPANRTAGHTIEGTEEELKKLGLSKSSRVYGVKVIITEN